MEYIYIKKCNIYIKTAIYLYKKTAIIALMFLIEMHFMRIVLKFSSNRVKLIH